MNVVRVARYWRAEKYSLHSFSSPAAARSLLPAEPRPIHVALQSRLATFVAGWRAGRSSVMSWQRHVLLGSKFAKLYGRMYIQPSGPVDMQCSLLRLAKAGAKIDETLPYADRGNRRIGTIRSRVSTVVCASHGPVPTPTAGRARNFCVFEI